MNEKWRYTKEKTAFQRKKLKTDKKLNIICEHILTCITKIVIEFEVIEKYKEQTKNVFF